ncbi:hypothetical protein HDU98_006720 [Podochytrium sp. JEL0797]|nr:hypothetical protein HDU98_006720 [Podochytrium sp. JEL0797]
MLECTSNTTPYDWLLKPTPGVSIPIPKSIDIDLIFWDLLTPPMSYESTATSSILDNRIFPFLPVSQVLPPVHPAQFSPTSLTDPFYFPSKSVSPIKKQSRQVLAARKWRAVKSAEVTHLDNRIQRLQDNKMALEKREAVLESVAATFGPRELELRQRIAMLEAQLQEIQPSLAKI